MAENKAEMTIPKVIQEELGRIENTRKRILDMAPLVRFAEEAIAKFKDLPGTSEWRVSLGYGISSLQGVLLRADTLDLRELTVVRRWLRDKGLPAPSVEDYGAIGRRAWTYRQKDKPNLVFMAFVRAPYYSDKLEGQKCEFVQVGVTEEPVYELRCDGKKLEENNYG